MPSTISQRNARSDGQEVRVVGVQEPRLSLVPEYVSSAASEAVELAEMAGLFLDPWQELVLRHSLGERASGKWSAFEVGLCVGRQNGKNAILEARELAELFLVAPLAGPRTVIHSAHLFPTSLEHFRRLADRIRDTPELARQVKRRGSKLVGIRESHGEEGIELVDGSRILFAARTKGGRRGFTIDLLVWDEAMDLPDAVVGSVMPTVSARTGEEYLPGPQIWYTGSAVNAQNTDHGFHLARVRARALRGEDDHLAYFEWSAPDDAESTDPVAWAQANPGLGIRITPEYVALERAAMPAHEFAVERLGQGDWDHFDAEAAAEWVIPAELWALCAERDRRNRIVDRWRLAVDANVDQTWGSVAVSGLRRDGLRQVAVLDRRRGTDWMVQGARDFVEDHPDVRVAVDKRGPAAHLIEPLKMAGLDVLELSTQDYGDACADFAADACQGTLRYPFPQPDLDNALAAARKQSLGDRWKWSRRSSTSADISPLVAATLARWAVGVEKEEKPGDRSAFFF